MYVHISKGSTMDRTVMWIFDNFSEDAEYVLLEIRSILTIKHIISQIFQQMIIFYVNSAIST
jgi:hypothetical protein